MQARFFAGPADLHRWLAEHHAQRRELLVGFHKTGRVKSGIRWPEAVDEALCCGRIDGVRRRVDEARYTIRLTPRKAGSAWSAVNVRKAQALIREERMQAAGLAAFRARPCGHYSYEQRPEALPDPHATLLAGHAAAARFFAAGRLPTGAQSSGG